MQSLSGVRILDFSGLLPGPAATWMLAGMGATVDRIERAPVGDLTRQIPPKIQGEGCWFASLNRGKRSVCLDLTTPEAQRSVLDIIDEYDVVIEGFRPGVMERFNLGPHTLRGKNDRLIYARITGFGQTGPLRNSPGHDINFVGLTGALDQHSTEPAALPLVQNSDWAGAYCAAMGICAALFERSNTGRGQVLDISITEAMLPFMAPYFAEVSAESREMNKEAEMLSGASPSYRLFSCKDGVVSVGALEPKLQQALRREVGSYTKNNLERFFLTMTVSEAVDRFRESSAVFEVLPAHRTHLHPQHSNRGVFFSCDSAVFVRPPLGGEHRGEGKLAALGEHTDEVLNQKKAAES